MIRIRFFGPRELNQKGSRAAQYLWSSQTRRKRGKARTLQHVGLPRKCMCGTVDASARWQAHHAQILKEHGFSPLIFVHVERDVRLLVHGDHFTVEMPTHEEKLFESVLFSKYDGKCTEKLHSDGKTAMEASFLNRVIGWDPTAGRADEPRRDGASRSGIGEFNTSRNSCGQACEVRRTSIAGRYETSECRDATLYRSVTMRVTYLFLDRPDLSFAAGCLAWEMKRPTTKDLEELKRVGHHLRGRRVGATVFEPTSITWSFGGVLRRRPCMLDTWKRKHPAPEKQSCGNHI